MKRIKDTSGYEGNQNAVKTGVHGAIKRISEGKPLIGIAAEEEKAVMQELELAGIPALKKALAVRLQSVLNLSWNTINKAILEGDLDTAQDYIKIFSLLSPRALAAWNEVQKDEKNDSDKDALELIERYRKGAAHDNDS